MGDKVLKFIIKEIQDARYFSLSVDSTPDISHVDQLTVVLRYFGTSDGEVAERFLTFIPIASHDGEMLATDILAFLKRCNIDIKICVDNLMTMQQTCQCLITVFKHIF